MGWLWLVLIGASAFFTLMWVGVPRSLATFIAAVCCSGLLAMRGSSMPRCRVIR